MKHRIMYQPSYSLLELTLEDGESVLSETGAMVSMTPNIQLKTAARGGILGGLKRSLLGGESFFINTFTCQGGQGELTLAPTLSGDVMHAPMTGGSLYVQSGSYLAGSEAITVDTKWGGARTFLQGQGLFLLKCDGIGDLFLSSYGAIHALELAPGQQYVVDTGHVVAFDGTIDYKVRGSGGLKELFLSGEGLVCDFTGPGRLYLQTRSWQSFLSFLVSKMPKNSGGS